MKTNEVEETMYKLTSKLIIYRNIGKDSSLFKIARIIKHFEDGKLNKEKAASLMLDEIYEIIDIANYYRFDSDLWTSYIAYLLATNENPFTLEAERTGTVSETFKKFAFNDFAIFRKIIDYDFSKIEKELDIECFSSIKAFTKNNLDSNLINGNKGYNDESTALYSNNASIRINELSREMVSVKDKSDDNAFYDTIMDFYKKYGVGEFGINKAFRISSDDLLVPIMCTSNMVLSDLIGYEEQKKQIVQNTEAFINGKAANNVLLYGDAGTGKSSSIKSLLNMYYDRGLRMIEVYKYDFKYLPEIISIIKNRNYYFIIYMDDLSFEKNETEYKYLKAVIEGGLEVRPSNVLVYATSNRVHLLHETFSDRKEVESDDVHVSDTLTEQTSLANRFGLTIGYFSVRRQEFFDMICTMASENEKLSSKDKNELINKAILWNSYHSDLSGRSARQFITYLLTQDC